jgi:hypothetical protein
MLVNRLAYVSWWPAESAGLGSDYHPIRNKSYQSDVADEGGGPDWTIHLKGLDEKSILNWWEVFGLTKGNAMLHGPLPPYNLLNQNCSTVVAIGLKQGGGDKYASWYSSWSVVWTPQAVLNYALEIKRGLGT